MDLVYSPTRPPWNERWMEVDEVVLYERLGNLCACLTFAAALCRAFMLGTWLGGADALCVVGESGEWRPGCGRTAP